MVWITIWLVHILSCISFCKLIFSYPLARISYNGGNSRSQCIDACTMYIGSFLLSIHRIMHRPGLYGSANFVRLLFTCGREICLCSTPSEFGSHLQCSLMQSCRPMVLAIYSCTRYVANTIALSGPTTIVFVAFCSTLQAPGFRSSINHQEGADSGMYTCLFTIF